MAVVLAFRAAIVLAPAVYRVLNGPVPGAGGEAWSITRSLWRRLHDPDELDADLSAALSAATGTLASVTTYSTSTMESRKVQCVTTRPGGATVPDDAAICTFHFAKITAGVVDNAWVDADFTALEALLDTFWTTWMARTGGSLVMSQYRWYKVGPAIEIALGGPGRTGPPVRTTTKTIAGPTSSAVLSMPPQVAITVTERTSDPKAWGRVYLPGPFAVSSGYTDQNGRIPSSFVTALATAAETLYDGALAAAKPVVVWSSAKPERTTKDETVLPAAAARLLTVDTLQVDDLFDVIRSRRWKAPNLRTTRTVGP